MQYQWYPGHMNKAKRQMQEDLAYIDVIIELIDARIPYSSKNPDIDVLAKGKARVLLLNKSDMADQAKTDAWRRHYEGKGYFTALMNSRSGAGIKEVNQLVAEACKAKMERDARRGILNRPVKAMIVGIPNVGKSTFINSFAGKACTKTGNKPGITKGRQWIKLNKNVELLDTPGILWPKIQDKRSGLRIALIGSMNETFLDQIELALELCKGIRAGYPGMLSEKYQIIEEIEEKEEKEKTEKTEKTEGTDDALSLLNQIAEKRGCLKKGGILDLERAAILLLDDFRNARIGRITLESI